MDKAFKEYVAARCSAALQDDEDYMQAEYADTDRDELQCMAEETCYIQGMFDLAQFMGVSFDIINVFLGNAVAKNGSQIEG